MKPPPEGRLRRATILHLPHSTTSSSSAYMTSSFPCSWHTDFRSYELAEPGAGIRAAIADGVARCGGARPGLRMLVVPAAGAYRRGGRRL